MQIYTDLRFLPLVIFFAIFILGGIPGVISYSDASEDLEIAIIDSWVVDGFEFHVGLQGPPSNASCSLHGEGLIEFEVSYFTPVSSEQESVFGVATWFPASDPEATVETYGEVIGPQGLCTESSPCRIRRVEVVQTWCPPIEGPLYPPGWF